MPTQELKENKIQREDLAKRAIPYMRFSDGSASSMTGPPAPAPHYISAEGRAIRRFTVEGNAIFTGGAGSIALTCARALLEHGLSRLHLLDISISPIAQEAIASLQSEFPHARITTDKCDVCDANDVRRAIDGAATDAFNNTGINILVCFAGVVDCQHALHADPATWKRTIDVNLLGSCYSAQAVARHMAGPVTPANPTADGVNSLKTPDGDGASGGPGGSIVFISSISSVKVNFPQPQAAYNASKAGLIQLKSSLAAEWAVHGIRVNAIQPGYMDTILNAGDGLAGARRIWDARNPMGRMGQPEEITGALVMLCSAQAGSYITGVDLKIDGGACTI